MSIHIYITSTKWNKEFLHLPHNDVTVWLTVTQRTCILSLAQKLKFFGVALVLILIHAEEVVMCSVILFYQHGYFWLSELSYMV